MPETKPFLDCSVNRGVLVLTILRKQIEGEDIAESLKTELLAAVTGHNVYNVILDLKNTRYVSSIAFWPLLALRRQLNDRGGRLLVCGLTGAVHEIFTVTKMVSSSGSMNAPFEMAPDLEAALNVLAGELPSSPAP